MNANYLFPHRYKKWGLLVFIPSLIIGFLAARDSMGFSPDWLDVTVFTIYQQDFLGEEVIFGLIPNNILDEIMGILIIISGLVLAFSKEKVEDELISNIRLKSLVWATYVNYGILFLAIVFVHDLSFYWIMMFNLFTILIFFIIRFNWQLYKLRKTVSDEE
ncbi:hypothetical protein [Gilvibacter sediminis]|uniref:hypothetical protein n=1 Tax=Gilvibacter sediminis TaxID=379071 RepID=UPI0023509172|nr:hypothetical protein [Gilvibacter sediminis]MDC7997147.1 hypothetical protein [Gilvibacter sediminis]